MKACQTKVALIRNNVFLALFISLLLMAGTLKKTIGVTQSFGLIAILLLLNIGVFFFFWYLTRVTALPKPLRSLFLPAIALLLIYLFGMYRSGITPRALITIGQLFLVSSFFFAFSLISWHKQEILVIATVTGLFILINILWWFAVGMPDWFSSYMTHKNALGGFLCGIIFFVLAAFLQTKSMLRFFWFVVLLLGILLLYLTNSRASWLAFFVMMITYFFWDILKKKKALYYLYFIVIASLIVVVTWVYPFLAQLEELDKFREIIQLYTGASLFSGRDRLWPMIIELIWEYPFAGYGPGALPRDFLDTTLSSHNLYLQVALQVGLVGLLIFVLLLFQIWNLFWLGRDDLLVRLSGAFLIGILVHQIFDVSLTQNNLFLGVLQWLILSIGASRSLCRPILEDNYKSSMNSSKHYP